MVDYSKQGKNNRRKGNRENNLAKKALAKVFEKYGYIVGVGRQYCGGDHMPDVFVSPAENIAMPMVWMECKTGGQGNANLWKALEQADRDRRAGATPVAHCRKKGEGRAVVAMYADDWLDWWEELLELQSRDK